MRISTSVGLGRRHRPAAHQGRIVADGCAHAQLVCDGGSHSPRAGSGEHHSGPAKSRFGHQSFAFRGAARIGLSGIAARALRRPQDDLRLVLAAFLPARQTSRGTAPPWLITRRSGL